MEDKHIKGMVLFNNDQIDKIHMHIYDLKHKEIAKMHLQILDLTKEYIKLKNELNKIKEVLNVLELNSTNDV